MASFARRRESSNLNKRPTAKYFHSGKGLNTTSELRDDTVVTWLHTDLIVEQQTGKRGEHPSTLAAALGHILHRLEILYGPRDTSFTVLGIEFRTGSSRLLYPENRRQIVIQLGLECTGFPQLAYYQLARECIYLLGPSGSCTTNMLEAGLSERFAQEYRPKQLRQMRTGSPTRVENAKVLVDELLGIDNSAVRRIRRRQSALSQVTAEDIHQPCPQIPSRLARALTRSFDRIGY